jgi:hypothetical protein
MNWPVGSQYADLTGKGSFVGIADEIFKFTTLNLKKQQSESMQRIMRTVEMRDYKRESRERPTKRMTEAMKSIVKYITANPGVERAEILKVVFNFSVISPSSLGSNLNSLIAQKIITSNGRTTKRKFYVVGAENE